MNTQLDTFTRSYIGGIQSIMTPSEAAQLRLSLGLSKYAVAKALGCSWQHYNLFEKGERKLSLAKLAKLEAFLSNHKSN